MSSGGPRDRGSNWQSFADLGLALMAVMLLIAVVLIRQKDQDAQKQKNEVKELRRFTVELLVALEKAQSLETQQEGVGKWVQTVFDETRCQLTFNPVTGTLEPRGEEGKSAELYKSGETEVSDKAREQLSSCRDAFLRLAICMGPDSEERTRLCPDTGSVRAFRNDIEALVLQGNTDKVRFKAERIHGLGKRRLARYPESFVGNAALGAERARQALGHLLVLIQQENDDGTEKNKPLQTFISRARIESPSFGRYQAGKNQHADCKADMLSCSVARNLSLKLRWRQESLRKPFSDVQKAFCKEWNKEDSPLRRSIEDQEDPKKAKANQERALKLCGPRDEVVE